MAWSEDAYAYLKKHREYVQRDLTDLREAAGDADQIARLERNLSHIDTLLNAYPVGRK